MSSVACDHIRQKCTLVQKLDPKSQSLGLSKLSDFSSPTATCNISEIDRRQNELVVSTDIKQKISLVISLPSREKLQNIFANNHLGDAVEIGY